MYVVFKAELNDTITILCFCRSIIDLLWPSCGILMMPFNSALKTTYIEKSSFYIRRTKTLSFCPSSYSESYFPYRNLDLKTFYAEWKYISIKVIKSFYDFVSISFNKYIHTRVFIIIEFSYESNRSHIEEFFNV